MKDLINDRHEIYQVYSSVCSKCIHFKLESFTCKAFPDEIPDKLLEGKIKHDKPLPEQNNNVIFKSK